MKSHKVDVNHSLSYDLHVHSIYSYDSLSLPKAILRRARLLGITGVAVTDHDTVRGAQRAMRVNRDFDNALHVIPGSEIKTDQGDVIGLFLTEEIKVTNIYEVLEAITEQNGFSILPHPYKTFQYVPEEVISKVNAVEATNGRISGKLNQQAWKLIHSKGLLYSGGSDAHLVSHVGAVSTLYDKDIGPLSVDNISVALKEPLIVGGPVSHKSHYYTVAVGNIRKKRFARLLKLGLRETRNYILR